MGVRDLLSVLRKYQCMQQLAACAKPEGARVAIDVPIFMHKFAHVDQSLDNALSRFKGLVQRVDSLQLKPVFVFDGSKLQLKSDEIKKRSASMAKQQASAVVKHASAVALAESSGSFVATVVDAVRPAFVVPRRADYDRLFDDLSGCGHECIRAKHEAEACCANLVTSGHAWAAITEDSDAIAFGSQRTIYKFLSPEPELVDLDVVLRQLQMTHGEFRDFCIILGNDFCERPHGLGPVKAMALVHAHRTWPEVYKSCKDSWPPVTQASAEALNSRYDAVYRVFATQCYECEPDAAADAAASDDAAAEDVEMISEVKA